MPVAIRPAVAGDEAALASLDLATWSTVTTPAAPPTAETPFFDARCRPEDVLVAESDGVVVGYIRTLLIDAGPGGLPGQAIMSPISTASQSHPTGSGRASGARSSPARSPPRAPGRRGG